MRKRLLVILAVGTLVTSVAAASAVAQDRPGWESENYEQTFEGYLNPCTGVPGPLHVDGERRWHVVERPNGGWREQAQYFAEVTWGNDGDWRMERRLIGSSGGNAQGSEYNGDFPVTGRFVGAGTFGWVLAGPDGGRWRLRGFSHMILVDGDVKFLKEWGGEPDLSEGEDVCVRAPRS